MFEIGGHTARLEFAEGTPLAGSVVTVSLDLSVRGWLALQRTAAGLDDETGEKLTAMEKAFLQFGEQALVSWDLGIDGKPLPANGEGMLSLPFRVANEIFHAWSAVTVASPNSNAVSASGESQEAASGQMAA